MTERRGEDAVRDAELAVLGAILLRNKLYWDISLSTEEFMFPKHRMAYAAISEMLQDGTPVDPILLSDRLDRVDERHGITMVELSEWPGYAALPTNIGHYEAIVRRAALTRKIKKKAYAVYASDLEGADLLAEAQRELVDLQTHGHGDAKSLAQVTDEVIQVMGARSRNEELPGIFSTGVAEFDHWVTMSPGGVMVVAGRPSMGKSAFCRWMTRMAVANREERALVLCTESHRREWVTKLLSDLSGVNSRLITRGKLSWDQSQAVKDAAEKIRRWPIWIDDVHFDLDDMLRQIRRFKSRHGITMVVLDHLQEVVDRRRRIEKDPVNRVLTEIRGACREEPRCYCVIASQLNRRVETREDKVPIMADLRASGRIEEVADAILLLYRGAYYYPKADPDVLEVGWAKNKNGVTGLQDFGWDPRHGHCLGPLAVGQVDMDEDGYR